MESVEQLFHNKFRIPSARADWHDYNGGAYFVTICTQNQEHFFGEIKNGEMRLSEIGEFTNDCIKNTETLHENVFVPIFQIMPDHIHLIIIMGTPVETSQCGVSENRNNYVKPIESVIETSYHGVSEPIINYEPPIDSFVETSYHGVSGRPIDSFETPHCDVSTKETKNAQMQNIANRCGKLSHIISRFKFVVTRFARAKQPYFAWQTRYYDRIIRDQDEMNRIAIYIENNVAKWNEGCEVDY